MQRTSLRGGKHFNPFGSATAACVNRPEAVGTGQACVGKRTKASAAGRTNRSKLEGAGCWRRRSRHAALTLSDDLVSLGAGHAGVAKCPQPVAPSATNRRMYQAASLRPPRNRTCLIDGDGACRQQCNDQQPCARAGKQASYLRHLISRPRCQAIAHAIPERQLSSSRRPRLPG